MPPLIRMHPACGVWLRFSWLNRCDPYPYGSNLNLKTVIRHKIVMSVPQPELHWMELSTQWWNRKHCQRSFEEPDPETYLLGRRFHRLISQPLYREWVPDEVIEEVPRWSYPKALS